MIGWSLNLFRVRGIQLAVHFSFFLLLAFIGFEGWQDGGWEGAFWNVVTLVAFFTCVVLHELGHSFTAMHFGIGVRRILLMPIGGMAEFETLPRQPARELWITFAGPAVNFAIAGVLALWVDMPAGWLSLDAEFPATLAGFAQMLVLWNLLMGLFNLVPAFPMDGGRILRALLATKLPYLRATFFAATTGKVIAGIAILLAVFVYDTLLTAVLFAFIFLVGEMEYRMVKRRERDEAQWRAMLGRFYAPEPPAEEPPILLRR